MNGEIFRPLTTLVVFFCFDIISNTSLAILWISKCSWLRLSRWRQVADTNLDVVALVVARVLALLLNFITTAAVPRKNQHAPEGRLPLRIASWTVGASQALLGAKAVVVAMYGGLGGPSDPLPSSFLLLPSPVFAAGAADGRALGPLAAVYASVLLSAATGVAEQILAGAVLKAILSRKGPRPGAPEAAEEPLLAGGVEPSEKAEERAPVGRILRALLSYAAPDWHVLAAGFLFGGLAAWAQALIPFYIGRIVDITGKGLQREAFLALVRRLLAVSAGCALFSAMRGALFTLEYAFLNRRIRSDLFGSLMRQDVEFFDRGKTGDVISRLTADVQTVSDSICLNSNVLSRSALQAAVTLYFMFTESEESWRLSVITFVLVPAILYVCKVYGGYFRKLQTDIQSALADANSVAEEMVGSMTTVKAHAAEWQATGTYFARLTNVFKLQRQQAAVYWLFVVVQTFLPNAMSALVLFYGGSLIAQGKMDSGSLVSFMLYQQSLSAAFQAMGDVFSNMSGAVGAAEKVVEMLRKEPKIPPSKGIVPGTFRGEAELRDVVFAYPTRPATRVLDGFSLTIRSGEVVALVGPSGGGKSSIVKLIQRFYVPISGKVLFDGRDVGDYDPQWLRQEVAMVGQEPVLYASSIRDNIVFGLPEDKIPSQEDVEAAARLANAHEFIMALPEGYHTSCGDKGVQISGGQKQRIAIARALVRKPSVLLLDEATSALDADSEHIVQEALDRVMRGRTVVVIAHRLSTVQDANRIIVVKAGRVAESGTHQQLVAQAGAYSALVRRQMARAGSGSFSSLAGFGTSDG